MKPKTDGVILRAKKSKHIQREGPNWILIVGGALLSTLSIKLGYRLKHALETKRTDNASNSLKGNEKSTAKRRSGACPLHSNVYSFTQDEDGCYHCLSGISEGIVEFKRSPTSPMSKVNDLALTIPVPDPNKDNCMIWASSPERLEAPRKPFHHSNSSDSPCVSESGSDIFSKREVIHKLRQQLKRRDEMILEMQAQITDLQNSLSSHITQSTQLQSQIDCANRDLFDSEREIQRLRKAIADHCVGDVVGSSPEKPAMVKNCQARNGFLDGVNGMDLECVVSVEKGRGDRERIEMLKREVGELKEVIEGKEFLLHSYKEQKIELSSKIEELQLRLASQVPNIL